MREESSSVVVAGKKHPKAQKGYNYTPEYTTLGISSASVYATIGSNCSVTIYDTSLTPYLGKLVEGGIVCDKRPCKERDDYISTIVSGPMLKESLPPNTKEAWREQEPCEDASKCGGFDYVSSNIYYKMWAEKGAKIGIRKGRYIFWNDGSKTRIPPYHKRYVTSDY
jgi:hypothetical protein